jgi:intracellular multiplication protein IcmC
MIRIISLVAFILLGVDPVLASSTAVDAAANFVNNDARIIESFIFGAAYLIGAVLSVAGLYKLKMHGEDPLRTPLGTAIGYVMVGTIILSGPMIIGVVKDTIYPTTSSSSGYIQIVPTMQSVSSGTFQALGGIIRPEMGQAIIGFMVLVGLISFFRGLYLLKEVGREDQMGGTRAGLGKALTHIIGGAMAINIVETSCLLGKTIGFSALCI